jgi:hypothetical protein
LKGYAYTDNDENINFRLKEFIDVQDPTFWDRNYESIAQVWEIDTENDASMLKFLSHFKRVEAPARLVINFCKSIQFDLEAFKKRVSTNQLNI